MLSLVRARAPVVSPRLVRAPVVPALASPEPPRASVRCRAAASSRLRDAARHHNSKSASKVGCSGERVLTCCSCGDASNSYQASPGQEKDLRSPAKTDLRPLTVYEAPSSVLLSSFPVAVLRLRRGPNSYRGSHFVERRASAVTLAA